MSESGKYLEIYKQKKKPYSVTFELTPFCNFNCNMCYIHLSKAQADKQGKLLTTDQWIDIASQTAQMGALLLEVTGGEALTRPDFDILYQNFIRMGYLITLRTNAYAVDDAVLSLLAQYKPRTVQVTMYGASDETYKKVCGVNDGFTVVSRNIERMLEKGIHVKVSMTITVDNVSDLQGVHMWCSQHNVNFSAFDGLINPIRNADRNVSQLHVGPSDDDCTITEDMKFKEYHSENKRDKTKAFSVCRKFGASFSISWDGRMMGCNALTSYWEEPLRSSVKDAFSALLNRLEQLQRPKECHECPYFDFCPACPVRFESATGDPEKCSDEICRLARSIYIKAMQIKEETL